MSVSFEIHAETRSDMGKGASRRLRRAGLVPGILYGAHQEPAMINVPHNELVQHLETEAFYSHVLILNLDGSEARVVLKDLQRHPAKPFVMHVDFQRISETERLRMQVPLHIVNESTAVGVKLGGNVSRNLTEIEISCLPRDLPEYIEVDIGHLGIGDSVHLSEVSLPERVVLAHAPDPDVPVVTVHGGHAGEEEEEGEGVAEGEEGTAAE